MRAAVPTADHELVSSILWQLQTTGIAEREVGPGRSTVELAAGFTTQEAADAAARALAARFEGPAGQPARSGARGGLPVVEPVDDRDWFDPDRMATVDLTGRPVSIEVGPAFGDGTHATTRLALDLLAASVVAGDRVLDVGTGTGILALAASRLGAAHVVAVESDRAALDIAKRNVERHNDLGPGSIELTDRAPAGTGPAFDVIVANVLLPVHREMAGRLAPCLRSGGSLIVCGVLASQAAEVGVAYLPLTPACPVASGDWVGLVLQ
jgi:ribosomal protein L11 methyltransferase